MCSDFLFLKKCSLDDLILEISVRIWKPLYYERSVIYQLVNYISYSLIITQEMVSYQLCPFSQLMNSKAYFF